MNDYTHTGPNQIARNFNESNNAVESNFSESLILDTLKGTFTLVKTFSILFLEIGLHQSDITEEELKTVLNF